MNQIHQGTDTRTDTNKGVTKIFTAIWCLKLTFMLALLYVVNSAANAHVSQNDTEFCEWVSRVASAVTENRSNGMDEHQLIATVLKTNADYNQQSVIIPIIDRIYREENNLNPQAQALIEYQNCIFTAAKYNEY